MSIVDRVRVTSPFRGRRKHDHAEGTIPGEWTHCTADVFLIRLPCDAGLVQESDKVERRVLIIDARGSIIQDTKIRSCLQPQVIRFAWVDTRRVVVLLSI